MDPANIPLPPSPPPAAEMQHFDPSLLFYIRGRFFYDGELVANEEVYRRNFGRGPSQQRSSPNQPPSRAGNSSPSAYSPSSLAPPSLQQGAPASPSMSSGTMQSNEQAHQSNQGARKQPFFFREDYAGYIVKGNFMTLAAKPHLVEEGEWMAHQSTINCHMLLAQLTHVFTVVEQNRNLSGMLKIVQEPDRSSGLPICNDRTCPAMSAGT